MSMKSNVNSSIYLAMAKDHIAILYYSIVLTVITVIVAIVIGMIQTLSLIMNVSQPAGRFWVGPTSVSNTAMKLIRKGWRSDRRGSL